MKVLFDAFWWVEGPTANRTVMRDMVFAWAREFPGDQIVLAVRREHAASAIRELDARGLVVEVVKSRLWPQGLSNALELPALARRVRADLTLSHNFAPLFGRSAVFIHDLMFEDAPEWFSKKELAYFRFMTLLARRASMVLTSTQTEARRISRVAPRVQKVVPVGLAVGSFMSEVLEVRPNALVDVPFILTVGRLNARKNLGKTLEAAATTDFVAAGGKVLVVGSSEYSGVGAELPADIQHQVDMGRVEFLGKVSDAELKWLYGHAAALIYTSLDEGFGLPPVEAGQFGCPVVVSNLPVFRETTEGLATFVDPTDIASIAQGIDATVGSDVQPMVRPGYTWRAVVTAMRSAASVN